MQPGLTKNMNEYDTCCRSCALYPGKGRHDSNCSGAGGSPTAAPRVRPSEAGDPAKFMAELTSDSFKLCAYIETAFHNALDNGSDGLGFRCEDNELGLNKQQLETAIDLLTEPFGGRPERLQMDKIQEVFDDDGDGKIDFEEFMAMGQEYFTTEMNRWFPTLLPLSTRIFVVNNPHQLGDVYSMGDFLGKGTFGTVYSATHLASGEWRVCKKVRKLKNTNVSKIVGEIRSMAMLDHPNVCKVYEWFESKNHIYQILEPLAGGELQERIDAFVRNKTAPPYGEPFISDVIKQVLRALAFMHSKRFMHKDLKPQNIMMVDRESSWVKVIDFGLAEHFGETQLAAKELAGTIPYLSPEGAKKKVKSQLNVSGSFGFAGLTFKSDIWSLGIILYQLITGECPFVGEHALQHIILSPVPQHPLLRRVKAEGWELMHRMLEHALDARPDAGECLASAWFKTTMPELRPLSTGIMQALHCFSLATEMKKGVLLLMAHLGALPAVRRLREIYTHFDVENRGTLDRGDLGEVLSQGGFTAPEIQRLTHALDRSGDGQIAWTEFLAGAQCVRLVNSDQLIDAAFAFFDEGERGMITAACIERKLAADPSPPEWAALWREHVHEEFKKAKAEVALEEEDEDQMSKAEFRAWMKQRLHEMPGDRFCPVHR